MKIISSWGWLRSGILLRFSVAVEFFQTFGFAVYFFLFFACAAFFVFEHAFYALGFCRVGFFAGALFGFELFAEAGGENYCCCCGGGEGRLC